MTTFDRVKMYYDRGWASKEQIGLYCTLGAITPEQYEQITGEVFEGV